MAHLDSATRQRLETLRATDTTGVYASDDPSEGTDPSGALSVTIDPTLRVLGVSVHNLSPLQTPDGLTQAFAAAYRAALAARLPRDEESRDAPRAERPRARRVRRVSAAPPPGTLNGHPAGFVGQGRSPLGSRRQVTGTSANECVSVTLPPAGPRGAVEADPGWLATTTSTRLAGAITEAFHDAYTRRDHP